MKLCFDVDSAAVPLGARDILYSALFYNDDALLFDALSEQTGFVYSIDSVFDQYRNLSVLKLEYEIGKHDLLPSLSVVRETLQKVKNGDFSFSRSLQKTLTSYLLMYDKPEALNWSLAYDNHILGGAPIRFDRPLLGRYESVTKTDVTAAARAIFRPENLTLAMKGNKKYLESLDFSDFFEELAKDSTE